MTNNRSKNIKKSVNRSAVAHAGVLLGILRESNDHEEAKENLRNLKSYVKRHDIDWLDFRSTPEEAGKIVRDFLVREAIYMLGEVRASESLMIADSRFSLLKEYMKKHSIDWFGDLRTDPDSIERFIGRFEKIKCDILLSALRQGEQVYPGPKRYLEMIKGRLEKNSLGLLDMGITPQGVERLLDFYKRKKYMK